MRQIPIVPDLPEVDVRLFGAQGVGDETSAVRDALIYAKANRKSLRLRDEVTYTVDSLTLDYSADAQGSDGGFRVPSIRGGGPRSTILQQVSGATDPLISVLGGDSGNTHEGKVTGFTLENLELRGTGTVASDRGTGGAAKGVNLSIYTYAALRNLYISRFTDGIFLDRPTKSATRDDMSQTIEIASVKTFQNSNHGIATSLVNSVGNADFHNIESSYNGGKGYELSSNQIVLVACTAIANGKEGLTSIEPSDVDSDGYGPMLVGFRAESNCNDSGTEEVNINGGQAVTIVGIMVLAGTGKHCLVIGNGSNPTRADVIGGYLAGNGPNGTGTAGQKALILGSNAAGSRVRSTINTSRFADASVSGNPMSVVTDSTTNSELGFTGAIMRSLFQSQRAATTDDAIDLRVFGDTQRHFRIRADGRQDWGDGSAGVDTNLYRVAANQLRTDDTLIGNDGVATKVKLGIPADGDFATTPPNGTIAIDGTNNKIYVRIGGTWKSVTVA